MTALQTSLPQKDGYFTLTKSGPQKMKNEMYFSPQKIIKVKKRPCIHGHYFRSDWVSTQTVMIGTVLNKEK